jgi:hypothetical protein
MNKKITLNVLVTTILFVLAGMFGRKETHSEVR